MQNKKLYIVGFGNHVKNKLIPALSNIKININGIISNNKNHKFPKISFEDLQKNTKCNSYVIVTGIPSDHVNLLRKISKTNHSKILVEKPIFVDLENFHENRIFFTDGKVQEAMMYKFNLAFRYSRLILKTNENCIRNIYIKFKLPIKFSDLKKSFRYTKNIKNSIVYDIGYYVFDLLWAYRVKVEKINLSNLIRYSNQILKQVSGEFLFLNGSTNYKIHFDIGYGDTYINEVDIEFTNKKVKITPFFTGRNCDIKFIKTSKNYKITKIKTNKNSYEKMMNYWYNNQDFRKSLELGCDKRLEGILQNLNELEYKVANYDIKRK